MLCENIRTENNQKRFYESVEEAITEKKWRYAAELIRNEINAGRLDTWYDCEPMLDAVNDAGYLCYECFLKAKQVIPKNVVCYADYGADGAEIRERNCGKNAIERHRSD